MMPQACPATVAVPETILVTLSTYGAVPALRTSLFVVSAHLHALGGVSQRPGSVTPICVSYLYSLILINLLFWWSLALSTSNGHKDMSDSALER